MKRLTLLILATILILLSLSVSLPVEGGKCGRHGIGDNCGASLPGATEEVVGPFAFDASAGGEEVDEGVVATIPDNAVLLEIWVHKEVVFDGDDMNGHVYIELEGAEDPIATFYMIEDEAEWQIWGAAGNGESFHGPLDLEVYWTNKENATQGAFAVWFVYRYLPE